MRLLAVSAATVGCLFSSQAAARARSRAQAVVGPAVTTERSASAVRADAPQPAFYTWQAPGGASTAGQRVIALTFDDGPSPYTPQILSVLEHYGVPATFFETGESVVKYPSLTRQVAAAGYPVENHTWSHPDLATIPASELPYQIDQAQNEITAVTGRAPLCLRPPYDAWNSTVLDQIAQRGLTTMSYSIDPGDWTRPGTQVIVNRVVSAAFPGGVVGLHDGGGPRDETVAALPQIIEDLTAQGYRFVSICAGQPAQPPSWSAWTPQGAPPGGAAQAPAVASWGPGRLDLFVKGGDGHLWHSWQSPGARFSPWEDLGGQLTSAPTAVSWGPDRIDVFVQGTDGGVWHKWWDGRSWSGWESQGGVLGPASAPAAASWSAGRIDVVVKGADNGVWHEWWDGKTWNRWESLGGICTGDPGAASWGPGALDVFCLGGTTDPPRLWHRSYRGSWSSFVQEVPGGWVDGINVATWAPNRLDVFGTDAATHALAHAWWDGQAWHKEVLDGVMASTPTAVSWAADRIDVFVLGTDGQLWHKFWGT